METTRTPTKNRVVAVVAVGACAEKGRVGKARAAAGAGAGAVARVVEVMAVFPLQSQADGAAVGV